MLLQRDWNRARADSATVGWLGLFGFCSLICSVPSLLWDRSIYTEWNTVLKSCQAVSKQPVLPINAPLGKGGLAVVHLTCSINDLLEIKTHLHLYCLEFIFFFYFCALSKLSLWFVVPLPLHASSMLRVSPEVWPRMNNSVRKNWFADYCYDPKYCNSDGKAV